MKKNSNTRILLWLFLILLVAFALNLSAGNFLMTSIFNSNAVIKPHSEANIDTNLEEYKRWLDQFEVNPEKFNNFVNENAVEIEKDIK